MTGQSNSLPSVLVATLVHNLALAKRAVKEAEQTARLAGLDPSDVKRALKLLTTDPQKHARQQERMGAILVALGAATASVEADLFERVVDESPAQRTERIRRDGYLAAVLGDACSAGALDGDDAQAWAGGWHAFHADRAAYEHEKTESQAAAA